MEDTDQAELIVSGLRENDKAASYVVGRSLSALFRDRVVVQAQSATFDLLEFSRAGHCTATEAPGVYSEYITSWQGSAHELSRDSGNSAYSVLWNGEAITVFSVSWFEAFHKVQGIWIIAADRTMAEAFLTAVSEWCSEVRGEILVFDGGCWHKSKELYDSVMTTTFDTLVLPADMKTEIQNDFQQFFDAREEYARYGIPWKRGVLFHGAPGNGKTHALKALINWLKRPCLYVKSFVGPPHESEHDTIRKVFGRARETTPCLLVFEDLDSLINDANRSYFLNEMDGFASNTGIVAVATTNHPERLDPAILERPSRFDRKYAFPLPTAEERTAYMSLWNERSQTELRLSENGLQAVAQGTEEFSFAYLKELWLSSMMRWVHVKKPGSMDGIMLSQVETLKAQMSTPISDPSPETDYRDDALRMFQVMRARRADRR